MNWGELWWTDSWNSEPHRVCILTRPEALASDLSKITVAGITSNIRDLPSHVRLDQDDGLPSECALNLDALAVLRRDELRDRFGQLRLERMFEVCLALRATLGCDAFTPAPSRPR